MKKLLGFLLALCLLLTVSMASAEITFDLSPFESDGFFHAQFGDTNEIINNCLVVGILEDDAGGLTGQAKIQIFEDLPPVLQLSLGYVGDEQISIGQVTLETGAHRYTFAVDGAASTVNGSIYETFVLNFTDQTISAVVEMLNQEAGGLLIRLSGAREVTGTLWVPPESLEQLYNAYVASGALENDFTELNRAFPCQVE